MDRKRIFSMLLVTAAAASLGQAQHDAAKKRILVLCTGNSARSQMAAGFLQSFSPKLEVYSAGTQPAARVNPHAIQVMREEGIDLSHNVTKSVNQFVNQSFDYVITVCDDADKNCPNFTGKVAHRLHIGFLDPAAATGSEEQILAVFRTVRDDIKTRFSDLYRKEIGVGL